KMNNLFPGSGRDMTGPSHEERYVYSTFIYSVFRSFHVHIETVARYRVRAVVAGKDQDGFVINTQVPEFFHEFTDALVHYLDHRINGSCILVQPLVQIRFN